MSEYTSLSSSKSRQTCEAVNLRSREDATLTTNLAACVCQCAKFDQNSHTLPLDRFLRSIVLYFLRETMI